MSETLEKNESKNVKSIDKALDILLCFSWDEKELTLTEIARKMGWAKSTTSRLLNTLLDRGFLSKDEDTNKYVLGSVVYYLGQVARETIDLRKVSMPILKSINQKTKETVHIYVYEGFDRICYEQVESPQLVKQSVKVGSREPIWVGATGKAILAYKCETEWYEAIEEAKKSSELNVEDFINNLKKVREDGYAIRDGKKDDNVGCVAAPLFDIKGTVMGCLAISTPAFRFPKNSEEYINLIVKGASEISEKLGYIKNIC
ncbi:DNA-binding IclR family transcriptional regulator [Sedimentibacter acidaminivorans]|uniref:DNA-binding IclR family transcriptional regulator n=1 Tax=Sedimentibacter acidaminivorans TaxID=913099 RepID=A0ABS4GFK6_9FIRM|nr:IclR family transcriptional regulator [Sedimentibacter acidaminivorans]MBP1926482.1 DNA-binding IclR family transcriptional regulator [Sedimentibacter acidaminivorans]